MDNYEYSLKSYEGIQNHLGLSAQVTWIIVNSGNNSKHEYTLSWTHLCFSPTCYLRWKKWKIFCFWKFAWLFHLKTDKFRLHQWLSTDHSSSQLFFISKDISSCFIHRGWANFECHLNLIILHMYCYLIELYISVGKSWTFFKMNMWPHQDPSRQFPTHWVVVGIIFSILAQSL